MDNSRIAIWDGWRGVAISLVLIGHFTFSDWIWEERLGVDVFFVLSGMLMSNILFIKRMELRDFYIRRISRVVPTLVVFLIAAFGVGVIFNHDFKITELIASLFFLRTYVPAEPAYFNSLLPTGHLWSLNVEEHSYIIMSLLTLMGFIRGRIVATLFGIYVFSVIVNFYNYTYLPDDQFEHSLIRTESAIGFIAFSAAYNLFIKSRNIRVNAHLPLVLSLLALVCYVDNMPIWLTFLASPVFLGIAVNHLADASRQLQQVLSFAPLRWLGVMSYSIYLWQQIFYRLYYALPGEELTGFVLSILVGTGSYFLIENPCRNYINGRWSTKPKYRL